MREGDDEGGGRVSDILTDRHKLYAILSIAVGAVLGLLSSVVAFFILSLIVGAGLTITGGFAFLMKSKYDKEEAKYRVWQTIALTSLLCAIFCVVFTIIGLYAHQEGLI